MRPTPVKKEIVWKALEDLNVDVFDKATIREIKAVAAYAERESGVEFIKMEMGVPGLPPSEVGVKAEIEALKAGVASLYPDIDGIERLKDAASNFVKAFIGLNVPAAGCIPVTGSMQGTFASFLTCAQSFILKDTILFIDPGFPVQKQQLQVMGIKYESFDVYKFRGEKLAEKLEEHLRSERIAAIIYSNPNNPSWVCLTEQELATIGILARQYDVIVIEDLAYFGMDFRKDLSQPYQAPYQSSIGRYTDDYILLISGSKAFSYAGQRIGVACISDHLYHRKFPELGKRYVIDSFGPVFSQRILYALSSGTSHSAQHALAAMFEAACKGQYRFLDEVKVYGERAHRMKEIFCRHGFHLVYPDDLGSPLADGFYFTVGYSNMMGVRLARELLYYGVSALPLDSTGSARQGVRVCTSFIKEHQYALLDERMAIFEENFPNPNHIGPRE